MRCRAFLAWVGCLVMTACGAVPMPAVPADPAEALRLGTSLLATSPPQSRFVLESIDRSELSAQDAEQFDIRLLQATAATGDLWSAYEDLRALQDRNRFSPVQVQIQELHFQIGRALLDRDATYFIFGSDRTDARIVLREFVERYPTDPNASHALELLGEDAFANGSWSEARRRFEQIIQDHPDSEWIPLAHFRRAMAQFAGLVGPEYDLPSLRSARNELRDYLAVQKPERPDFRVPAESALATADDWLARRYLIDAGFYKTLGNGRGERYWLEEFLAEYGARPEAETVRTRISELVPRGESGS